MKAKDLFKKIESVNFVYGATNAGGQVYITCNIVDADEPFNVLPVVNPRPYPYKDRFHSWKEFSSTVNEDLVDEIRVLIETGELKYSEVSKTFYLENADWIIRFYVWDE